MKAMNLETYSPKDALENAMKWIEHGIHGPGLWPLIRVRGICDEMIRALTGDQSFRATSVGSYDFATDLLKRVAYVISGVNQFGRICCIHLFGVLSREIWQLPNRFGLVAASVGHPRCYLRDVTETEECPWVKEKRISDELYLSVCITTEDILGKGKGRYYADVPFVQNDFPRDTMDVPTLFLNSECADGTLPCRLVALLHNPFDPACRGYFPELEKELDYWRGKMEAAAAQEGETDRLETLAKIIAVSGVLSGDDITSICGHMPMEKARANKKFWDLFIKYLDEYDWERLQFAKEDNMNWMKYDGYEE